MTAQSADIRSVPVPVLFKVSKAGSLKEAVIVHNLVAGNALHSAPPAPHCLSAIIIGKLQYSSTNLWNFQYFR
ncbi:MAG: hypothetical protein AAFR73_08930 [Pseudomonadota bacterium]